jgi:butyryl-CoA dehydrogenase
MVPYGESAIHDMLRTQARELSSRIAEECGLAPQREPESMLKGFQEMSASGYPGILIPPELEGEGGGWAEAAIIIEELAARKPVLAMVLLSHLACTAGLVRWADEERMRDFLPPLARGDALGAVALTEPEAGMDFAALRASLGIREDIAYANGNKCFVTNIAPGADSGILTFLRGTEGIAAAYIPSTSPGLHLAHHYRFSGWEGLPNHALVLQDCAFPASHVLREGLEREDLLSLFDGSAILVTAMAAGMARACLEEAWSYTKERVQGGKRLAGHQALRFRMADMATSIDLVTTSLRLASARLDAGESLHREACMLKLFATGELEAIASSAMEMAGGYGYTLECRLSSLHRDAKGLQLFWGTRELMRLEIASELGL